MSKILLTSHEKYDKIDKKIDARRINLDLLDIIAAKSCAENPALWLPFNVHAIDTEKIIEKLFNRWLSESERLYIASELGASGDKDSAESIACRLCRFIALIHDIGKITPAFQFKITSNIENHKDMLYSLGIKLPCREPEKSPHNLSGQFLLKEMGINEEIAVIVGAHHGNCSDSVDNQEIYEYNLYGNNKAVWDSCRKDWLVYALNKTGFDKVEDLPVPNVKVQMLLCGLLIMSDWIASNISYFPLLDTFECSADFDERARNAWKKLGFTDCWNAENAFDFNEFFMTRFGFEPNSMQKEMLRTISENPAPALYILEAPMGIGKTEAALSSAEILAARFGLGGLFFGLPTQATANGVFTRIHSWAEKLPDDAHSMRLVHGMTELNEEYTEMFRGTAADSEDECVIVHEWFNGRKQALLSDFVVGTIDQLLMASLIQRHVMLRHLGLAGKVVVIDECHAYDAYMNVYLDRTLAWLGAYKIPVLLLSATLPKQRRNELIQAYRNERKPTPIENSAYPSLTYTSGEETFVKEIKLNIPKKSVRVSGLAEHSLCETLSQKLSDGGCAAVIVNSVSYSQKLAETVSAALTDFRVICFHSRFIAAERAEIENELLTLVGKNSTENDRNKVIIIGTQVLEQSLDLDFDYMVTQLCPMDLLLQRSGRLHRHNRPRPNRLKEPELSILTPSDENMKSVYSEWILSRTEKNMPDKLEMPDCIPELVEKVYSEPSNEEKTDCSYIKFANEIKTKTSKAKTYCIKSNNLGSKRFNLLSDFLTSSESYADTDAEAAVRDTDETIEVLVLIRNDENSYADFSRTAIFNANSALEHSEERLIANQRLKLLPFFAKYHFRETLESLTPIPKSWRDSKLLKDELLLILDKNGEAELLGKRIRYTKERGLEELKEQNDE